MTQSDRQSPRHPKQSTDSTRPARTGSRTRRGGDRKPYPTAPARTTPSSADRRRSPARARSRGSATTPTPATVWACGPTPTDPDATWPTSIVETILTSFSKPGAQVMLLQCQPAAKRPAGPTGVLEHDSGSELGDGLTAALATVEDTGRTARVTHVGPDASDPGPVSRPFRGDLVGGSCEPVVADTASSSGAPVMGVSDYDDVAAADTDLIITSLRSTESDDHTSDRVAQYAARVLRVGGTLAVLTHSDWLRGELVDPTGAVVAAAQNADLLYLQHIVALHAPIRDGRFADESGPSEDDELARLRHRAHVRGLPAPHRRIHSDVLAFAQPHDHEPLLSHGAAAFETGVIR